jgi:hypothetical protein
MAGGHGLLRKEGSMPFMLMVLLALANENMAMLLANEKYKALLAAFGLA